MKEFSKPQRNTQAKRPDKPAIPPSKFHSSGFQSFKGEIKFKISNDDKLQPHQIARNNNIHDEKSNENKEINAIDQNFLSVPTSPADISISQRLSRSMESLDNILKELSDVISKDPKLAPVESPKRLSSSLLDLNVFDKTPSNADISKSLISSESCKYSNCSRNIR